MKKCIVIGGGFAGLSSAAYLAAAGIKTELIESSPKLGGRAYSFKDENINAIADNGQHIMMGCYFETLKYLELISALDNLVIQKKLKVNFLKENFDLFPLEAGSFPYPLNLISALANYKAISTGDRLKILSLLLKLPFVSINKLAGLTVLEWLDREGQNEATRKAFWEVLAVGALNTNIRKASAGVFADILRQIFLRGNKAATIILPKYGLSETYCQSSLKFIEKMNGRVITGERVLSLENEGNFIKRIITNIRTIDDFDYIVSAVPWYTASKIIPGINPADYSLDHSSILSVHLRLSENFLNDTFYGFIDSPVHWVFSHGTYITVVISDANEIIEKEKSELFDLVSGELEKYLPIKKGQIESYTVIKEKRATFIPSKESSKKRPAAKTKFNNLFLAGDWTDTGLPSTIESAVKSGRTAAELIIASPVKNTTNIL